MPILREWNLPIDADKVLWGQGADPKVMRARRPKLVSLAEEVIAEGIGLIQPAVVYERMRVVEFRHERLVVEVPGDNGASKRGVFAGPLIAKELGPAQEVVAAVCTVGDGLSIYAESTFSKDMVRALALDGLASAATEALSEAMCYQIEQMAAAEGLQTSVQLNPGMIGWPILEGQQQLFELVDAAAIGVALNSAGLMVPLKSVSLVVGLGREMNTGGKTCDYCAMRELCRYRDGS